MPKTKTRTAETPVETSKPYVETPVDRCTNVAGRLQAVLMLLDGCLQGDQKGDEGWTLATVRHLLEEMQADLRETVAHVDAEIATTIAGGAR